MILLLGLVVVVLVLLGLWLFSCNVFVVSLWVWEFVCELLYYATCLFIVWMVVGFGLLLVVLVCMLSFAGLCYLTSRLVVSVLSWLL